MALSAQVEDGVNELFRALARFSFAWLNLIGQDKWADYVVTRSGFTEVGGAPTLTGRFYRIGKICFVEINVDPATSIASVAGTSYLTLPLTASGLGGSGSMFNAVSLVASGSVAVDVTNSRVYTPALVASGDNQIVSLWYEVP